MTTKLTKAQKALLMELYEDQCLHIVEYYAPGIKLVELGLAVRDKRNYMTLTAAGVAMAEELLTDGGVP